MSSILKNIWFWVVLVFVIMAVMLKVNAQTIRTLLGKLRFKETELKDSTLLQLLGIIDVEKKALEKELSKKEPDRKAPEEVEDFWKQQLK